jgi:hypothetical protein
VSLLDAFKAEQQPLELICPGRGSFDPHPQRMDGAVEEAFASTLGRLAVARILCDVGNQAGIEDAPCYKARPDNPEIGRVYDWATARGIDFSARLTLEILKNGPLWG